MSQDPSVQSGGSANESLIRRVGELIPGLVSYLVCGNRFDMPCRYQPLRPIGRGGFGFVCSAMDTVSGQAVAIKKIQLQTDVDWKRTLREMRLLKHFHHENVIKLLDIFEPASKIEMTEVYLVLELMDSDLHQIVSSNQPLTEDHHQFFLYQMLKAVKYIHSARVLHRDLKPSNIFLNRNCLLKVADFGLARVADPSQVEDSFLTEYVATRWYRAPEVILSWKRYTNAIDIWSIGCIFAEILLRRPLFPGKDYVHQIQTIVDFLGTPSSEDILDLESDGARNYILGLGHRSPVDLRRMFPPGTSDLALDILQHMLQFNPARRITVEEALSHPYFEDLRDEAEELDCDRSFDFSFERWELSKEMYRELIWGEMMTFHPDAVARDLTHRRDLLLRLREMTPSQLASPQGRLAQLQAHSYAKQEFAYLKLVEYGWLSAHPILLERIFMDQFLDMAEDYASQ